MARRTSAVQEGLTVIPDLIRGRRCRRLAWPGHRSRIKSGTARYQAAIRPLAEIHSRARRWASAISRAVISSETSARHSPASSWPADGGEVEPLVRLDHVAGDAVAAGREGDPEVEVGCKVALRRSGEAIGDQHVCGTVSPASAGAGEILLETKPCSCPYPRLAAAPLPTARPASSAIVVNKWLTRRQNNCVRRSCRSAALQPALRINRQKARLRRLCGPGAAPIGAAALAGARATGKSGAAGRRCARGGLCGDFWEWQLC